MIKLKGQKSNQKQEVVESHKRSRSESILHIKEEFENFVNSEKFSILQKVTMKSNKQAKNIAKYFFN